MLPWKLPAKTTEEQLIIQWAKVQPAELCFGICHEDDDDIIVLICPILYFAEHNYMYHDSMPITHLLPEYLVEIMPSTYCPMDPEDKLNQSMVYKDLMSKGFSHSPAFQAFVDMDDWYNVG